MSLLVHTITTGGAGSTITSPAIDTTGCKFLAVLLTNYNAEAAAVLTDSKGNTWVAGTTRTTAGGGTRMILYHCLTTPIVGAGHTFTATQVGSGFPSLLVAGFSDTITAKDQAAFLSSSSSGSDNPTVTPTESGELLIAVFGGWGTNGVAIDLGFTITDSKVFTGGNSFNSALAYKVQAVAAAIAPSWTWTGGNAESGAELVSFKLLPAALGGTQIQIF